jgi:rubredoxin-NAD+ reductase
MVQSIRDVDADVPITLVTACSGDVYDKPLLSVAMAKHIALEQLVRETGAQAAQRLGVNLLAQTQATRICTRTQTLHTTRGKHAYEQLVLAHGAQAALPANMPAELCWRINHLDAYLRLRAALGGAPRDVAIVGAGLIGSELANDLALGGHRITLLDVQPEPLARWQAEKAGQQVLQAWKDLPIRFVGSVSVSHVEKIDARMHVTTACGQQFVVDQVIAATGLQTPNRLAQAASLKWNNGIAVDPRFPAHQQRQHSCVRRLHHGARTGQSLHRTHHPPGPHHCRQHLRMRACSLRSAPCGGSRKDDFAAADTALMWRGCGFANVLISLMILKFAGKSRNPVDTGFLR